MAQSAAKNDIIQQLQKQVLAMQGYKDISVGQQSPTGLGPIELAFPGKVFPTGAVHEFLSPAIEDVAATNGFISGLLGGVMKERGACLWVSNMRTVFPPALKRFGIAPERVIFVDLARPKEALWAIEEALKCASLAAVVGEIRELGFTESRRLQLAVEQSHVTGFIHRHSPRTENPVACVTRWKIKALASGAEGGLPGPGHPRWDVQLLKVRNGLPGSWQVEWSAGSFRHISKKLFAIGDIQTRKAG